MASVKFGGGVLDARGSIGGQTFSRNSFGAYIRSRVVPTNPNTARQQAVRAAVSYLVDRWTSTLTPAQREAWALYAANISMLNKLGESIKLSGFNHFVRSNAPRKQALVAVVDDAPTEMILPAAAPEAIITVSVADAYDVTFDNAEDWANENGAYMLCYAGQPVGPGRSYLSGPFRYVGKVAGDSVAPPASPATLAGSGWPRAADNQCLMYHRISRADGRLSVKMQTVAVIVA
jgi:hypothetical protein